jgi:hypothetical protein
VLLVPLGPIRTADRRLAWQAALPGAYDEAAVLAARHPLDPAVTALVALDVDGTEELHTGPIDVGTVSATIRARAGIELPAGVDLLSPRAGWGRLVLAGDPERQLRDTVSRLARKALVLDGGACRRPEMTAGTHAVLRARDDDPWPLVVAHAAMTCS